MRVPTKETPTAAPRDRKRKEHAVATAWSAAETLDTSPLLAMLCMDIVGAARRTNRNEGRCHSYALSHETDDGSNVDACKSTAIERRRHSDRYRSKSSGRRREYSEPIELACPLQNDSAKKRSHNCGNRGRDKARPGLRRRHFQNDLEEQGQVEYQGGKSCVSEEVLGIAGKEGFVKDDMAGCEWLDGEARFNR